MYSVKVAVSTVADGSMYLRSEPGNETILDNRDRWFNTHGLSTSNATRVYITYDGDDFLRYSEVGESDKGSGMVDDKIVQSDALITTSFDHVLFLPVADCIATTIFDPEHGKLMLTHLGRHSLEQEGGVRSVEYMVKKYGSRPESLQVWATPSVGKEAYPIYKLGGKGMKEVFFEQMAKAGVVRESITDISVDTATDTSYYSHSEYLKGNKPQGSHAMLAVMYKVT